MVVNAYPGIFADGSSFFFVGPSMGDDRNTNANTNAFMNSNNNTNNSADDDHLSPQVFQDAIPTAADLAGSVFTSSESPSSDSSAAANSSDFFPGPTADV